VPWSRTRAGSARAALNSDPYGKRTSRCPFGLTVTWTGRPHESPAVAARLGHLLIGRGPRCRQSCSQDGVPGAPQATRSAHRGMRWPRSRLCADRGGRPKLRLLVCGFGVRVPGGAPSDLVITSSQQSFSVILAATPAATTRGGQGEPHERPPRVAGPATEDAIELKRSLVAGHLHGLSLKCGLNLRR
jgi:hypothetical protein